MMLNMNQTQPANLQPRFSLGQVVITEGINALIDLETSPKMQEINTFLIRHLQ